MTLAALLLAALLVCALLLAALRRRYVLVTVVGDSMLPAFRPGDRLLVRRGLTPTPGQVIVFTTPPPSSSGQITVMAAKSRRVAGHNRDLARPARLRAAVPTPSGLPTDSGQIRDMAADTPHTRGHNRDLADVRRSGPGGGFGRIRDLAGKGGGGWVVKRVAAVAGDVVPDGVAALVAGSVVPPDRLVVLGDNPARSFDSRQSGYLHAGRVLGVVLRRIGQSAQTPPEADEGSDNR